MVANYVASLARMVSQSRLQTYEVVPKDDLETIVNYLWNVALAESLVQSLAALEVALRNSIHTAFTAEAGTDQWFWALLKGGDLRVLNEKWAKVALRLKRPPTPGQMIAEMTFGFWPYLFDRRYSDFWWNNKETMLRAVFPYLPTNQPPHLKINRNDIYDRLSLFRDLRNRVAHHEPIFYGIARAGFGTPPPIVPLDAIHAEIVEMLGWIDPEWPQVLGFVDRFPDVFTHERARIRARLEAHFNTSATQAASP